MPRAQPEPDKNSEIPVGLLLMGMFVTVYLRSVVLTTTTWRAYVPQKGVHRSPPLVKSTVDNPNTKSYDIVYFTPIFCQQHYVHPQDFSEAETCWKRFPVSRFHSIEPQRPKPNKQAVSTRLLSHRFFPIGCFLGLHSQMIYRHQRPVIHGKSKRFVGDLLVYGNVRCVGATDPP